MTNEEIGELQGRMSSARSEIMGRFERGVIDFTRAEVTHSGVNVLRTEIYSDGSRIQYAGNASNADPHVQYGEGMALWSVTLPAPPRGSADLNMRQIGPVVSEGAEGASLAWESARDVLLGLIRYNHKPERLMLAMVPDNVVNTMKDTKSCKAILASLIGSGTVKGQANVIQPTLRKEAPKIPIPPGELHSQKLQRALLVCLISPEIEVRTDSALHPWDVDLEKSSTANLQCFVCGEVSAVVLRLLGRAMDGAYEHEQQTEERERAAGTAFARPIRNMKL